MTAQISEILHYQGRKQRMCTEPLGDSFALACIEPRFGSAAPHCQAAIRGGNIPFHFQKCLSNEAHPKIFE